MKKTIIKLTLIFLIGGCLITSCKKDDTRPNPTISFITDEGYTSADVTISAGDTVRIGLNCNWNGTDLLTTINYYANYALVQTSSITPAGETGSISFTITKTDLPSEFWEFELVDANGQKAVVSLLLTKETTGGTIDILTNIKVGAQGNTITGSFYSFSNNTNYLEADAETNQTLIDIVGAYSTDNGMHLASPGANLTGIFDLSSWTATNTTYYCAMDISTLQYEFIESDKFIIDSFDNFLADDKKQKAQNLQVDDIYVFKTESAKYGILKVTDVTSGENGSVTFDVKIQE